jgi:hypothetical protein
MKTLYLKSIKIKLIAAVLFIFTATSVYAFGLGDLGNMVGGGGDSGPDLGAKQTAVTASLTDALKNLSKSQSLMLKALGLDEQAKLSEENQKCIAAGDCGAKDDIEKAIELSESSQKAIVEEIAKGKTLDAESKAVFVTSVPFYIKGAVGTIKTGKEAVDAGKSLASAGPMALLKVGTLVTIVSNLPTLVTKLASSTGSIVDFMSNNGLEDQASDMKSKIEFK